jgi:hypothetical protein
VATARRRARATGTGTIAGLSEDTKPEPLSGRMACRPSAAVVAGALDRRAGSGWSRQHLGHRRPARSGGQVDVDSSRMVWQPYVQANIWRDWGGKAETMFGVDSVSLIEQVTRLEFAGGIIAKLDRGPSSLRPGRLPVRHRRERPQPARRDGVKGEFGCGTRGEISAVRSPSSRPGRAGRGLRAALLPFH